MFRTVAVAGRLGLVGVKRNIQGRQIIDANVSDLSLVDDPQDHIAFTLIEELRDRIVAKIDPRIRPKMICAIMPYY